MSEEYVVFMEVSYINIIMHISHVDYLQDSPPTEQHSALPPTGSQSRGVAKKTASILKKPSRVRFCMLGRVAKEIDPSGFLIK